MSRLAYIDRLLIVCVVSGFAGFWLVWPPLSFLFLSAVALTLAVVSDLRTSPEPPEVEP